MPAGYVTNKRNRWHENDLEVIDDKGYFKIVSSWGLN
jgi:hypothetical protein